MSKPSAFTGFRAPQEIVVSGDALSAMNLEQYMALLKTLGTMGLHATVADPADPDTTRVIEQIVARPDAELIINKQPLLVSQQQVYDYAAEQGMSKGHIGKAWRVFRGNGYFAPLNERGIVLGESLSTKQPVFYYPDDGINPLLKARAHGVGIDLERGFNSPKYLEHDRNHTEIYDLADGARLDIHGLGMYLSDDYRNERDLPNLGEKILGFYTDYAAHVVMQNYLERNDDNSEVFGN